jgi:hypothetical protein
MRREGNYSNAIISKSALEGTETHSKQIQSAIITIQQRRILLCNVHMDRSKWEEGLQQLQTRLDRRDYETIVIGGDFNMDLTDLGDYRSRDGRLLVGWTQSNNLTIRLPARMGTFGTRKTRILDYFIVSKDIESSPVKIIPYPYTTSDHLPVEIQIAIPTTGPGKSWIPNPEILAEPRVSAEITTLLNQLGGRENQWVEAKEKITAICQKHAKRIKKDHFRNLDKCRKKIATLMSQQPPDLRQIEQMYKEAQIVREETIIRTSLETLKKGGVDRETATKAFFKQELAKSDRTIPLKAHDEQLKPDEIAYRRYTELFNDKGVNRKNRRRLARLLGTFATEEKAELDREISKEEVVKAIEKSNQASSPGPDGLGFYFYKRYIWDLAGPLTRALNAMFINRGELQSFYEARTILLYKKGDRHHIDNYRPISITNCDARILSSILARRLNGILEKFISKEQRGFIAKRYTQDLAITSQSIIRRARKDNRNIAIVQLDWEKAYDRIDHKYLFDCISKVSGKGTFSQWVRSMYLNSSMRISINGKLSERITPRSGVRQGCPISPLIFNITIEPLILMVKNNRIWRNVYGHRQLFYADDSTFFLEDRESVEQLLSVLETYERGSGAKQNRRKTIALIIGEETGLKDHIKAAGYDQSTTSETVLVGYPIGPKVDETEMWKEAIDKIQKSLNFWRAKNLSLYGKKIIVDTKIMSRIIYLASLFKMPSRVVKRIEKITDEFLFPKAHERLRKKPWQLSKEEGGLGVTRLEDMNQALLTKIGIKLLTNSDDIWADTLREELDRELPGLITNKSCPKNTPKWLRQVRQATRATLNTDSGHMHIGDKEIPLNKYSTKLGRKIIYSKKEHGSVFHRRWSNRIPASEEPKILCLMKPKFYPKKLLEFRWRLMTMTIYHFNWRKPEERTCPFCRTIIEDITHVITQCPIARETWKSWTENTGISLSVKEKLFGPTKKKGRKWQMRINSLYLLKKLWLNFWDRVKDKKCKDPQTLVNEANIEATLAKLKIHRTNTKN